MNILIFPIRFLYKLYFFLYFVITLLLFYPVFKYLLSEKERFPKAFKVIKVYAKVWLYGSGIFLRVKGRENIITGQPFLICSNHSSFIDPATLYIIFDQHFVFTGKKEIEKWPLFHIFYTSGMNILVDRHNRLGALKSFKKMMDVIAEGYPLVILPEGTIPQNAPNLGEFKPGAVSIAIQTGIPILPITQTTNWKRLQRGTMFKGNASPGIAEVIIHPLIPTTGLTKQDAEALSEKLRNVINKPLQEKYGVS
ncbi:lysophospholipid acyltransferase family protein [Labilibaculum sp.]|uniref:lysophospholipid acyltransferase family protein n=1 Tax=Labilibaculum sp. TaxID=2060723 RepID=UPI002AA61635|nr:lysophospholipid acyltransferase family protein [Labilibaculum sp.]MBN2595746.1 1-acyl-sn-glycerol-3-phosphate acyltransferase [Marinifilaceae bacterium]